MTFIDWIRRVFSSPGPEDEAAEREEYGLQDRGEDELRREPFRGLPATEEGAETEEADLESFRKPPDPDP